MWKKKQTIKLVVVLLLLAFCFPVARAPPANEPLQHETTTQQNHYRVLGVAPWATQAEIKRAWHDKSRQLHPDKRCAPQRRDESNNEKQSLCATDPARINRDFAKVSTAYEVLSDAKRRRAYDAQLATTTLPSLSTLFSLKRLSALFFHDFVKGGVRKLATAGHGLWRLTRRLARRGGLLKKRVRPSNLGHDVSSFPSEPSQRNLATLARGSLVAAFTGYSTPVTFASFYRRLCRESRHTLNVDCLYAVDCTRWLSCLSAPHGLRPLPSAVYVDHVGRIWRLNATTVPKARRDLVKILARAQYEDRDKFKSVQDLRRLLLRKYADTCPDCGALDRDAFVDRLATLDVVRGSPHASSSGPGGDPGRLFAG